MNSFKKIFGSLFSYSANKNTYDFTLAKMDSKNDETFESQQDSYLPLKNISSNLSENIDYLKVEYNYLINSDIIFREFDFFALNKKHKALLVFIDGMVNSDLINNYTLKPLMNVKKTSTRNISSKNISVKKISNTSLEDYLTNRLIPQNSIKKLPDFESLISSINIGNCALFVDGLSIAYSIDVKGFETRSVSNPSNEIVIRGSQEAFVEKLRTNTSMLRKIINSENLIIEQMQIGKVVKTAVAICYMKNITNNNLVAEVKYRLNNIDIDFIVSSGQLEQLIQDEPLMLFPQMMATERPDKATNNILKGRVVVLVNGSPYALIMPGVFLDFLSSPEDMNLKYQYSNLLKFVRLIAVFITLMLPGLYVAITNYHIELIPTELLLTIAASRNTVPFPVIFEILIMEISFELIREAGVRVPSPIGPTIGIVGALILGEAAVNANIVSPILIIIVALTGISSFATPDFSLSFSIRVFRFIYIMLGYIAGFLGISLGLFIQLGLLANLKSFGVPYLAPYLPVTNLKTSFSYFIPPLFKREKRADFLNTKRSILEPKTSMKWKYRKEKNG